MKSLYVIPQSVPAFWLRTTDRCTIFFLIRKKQDRKCASSLIRRVQIKNSCRVFCYSINSGGYHNIQFSRDALSNHMIKKVGYGYVSGETEYNRREEGFNTVTCQERKHATVKNEMVCA